MNIDFPWKDCGKDFDDWFESAYKWSFFTRWFKPIAKKFAANGWDAAVLRGSE